MSKRLLAILVAQRPEEIRQRGDHFNGPRHLWRPPARLARWRGCDGQLRFLLRMASQSDQEKGSKSTLEHG